MEVRAQLNNLRLAPRKVRAVANLIRGKNVPDALAQLEYLVKRPALPIKKLLDSGVANAESAFNLVKSNLYIKSIIVNEGVKLKRFKPKGFGRAALIQKKTSRIILTLDEKVPGLRGQAVKTKDHKKEEVIEKEAPDMESKKPEVKRELGKKSEIRGMGNLKKLFRRKTIG